MRGPALALIALLSACATPLSALSARREVETPAGKITVCSLPDRDTEDAAAVAKAVERAAPKLGRWGAARQPIEVHVLPSHWDFALMTRRIFGWGWLHAWATWSDVLLDKPSIWMAPGPDLDRVLAHELTHCLMFQKIGDANDWRTRPIPTWFKEGMATWTAEQGSSWMTLEDLARVYEETPPIDPLTQADALYKDRNGAVYAAANYAFAFLVRRYGQDAIEHLLAGMSRGEPFDAAFRHAIGLETRQFTTEFRRYVVWRGFKGSARRRPGSAQ